MADGTNKPIVPKGRGASILAALKKQRPGGEGSSTPSPGKVQDEPTTSVEAPKSCGRASMLEKLRQMRLRAGQSEAEQSASTEGVRERLAATSLATAEPRFFRGNDGRPETVATNYLKLKVEGDRGVYEYDLRFKPEVDDKRVRFKLLALAIAKMGGIRIFDGGNQLFLPIVLPQSTTVFPLTHPYTENDVDMIVSLKGRKRLGECLQLFNILFKRIMQALTYSRVGRNYYNPKRPFLIPQHKLEVLPGYAIAVDEYEGGVMLCLDTQHRVMRSETVLDVLHMLRNQNLQNLKKDAFEKLVGETVMTKYNNRTYEIHEILWTAKPTDTFKTSTDKEISYIDYYVNQYNINIKDSKQPLLVNRPKKPKDKPKGKESEKSEEEMMICLIPELCYLTGLSDAMRSDFRVMKDVAAYTRVSPNQRINALRQFLKNVSENEQATRILSDWGLAIDNATVDIMARVLDAETVLFGGGVKALAELGEFTPASIRNPVLTPADLKRWVIVHTVRDERIANEFAQNVLRLAGPTGMMVNKPDLFPLRTNQLLSYTDAIRSITPRKPQMLVFIVPTQRDDLYSYIKKICCTEHVVPTQVVLSRTLSKPDKVRTITQKILLQMNCKLGGALWSLRFPFKKWMICGLDVYHSTTSKSVCGFVASINESISRWFSATVFQSKELTNQLKITFAKALERWSEVNGCFPTNIVIYRDGVGHGQLQHVVDFEVTQLEECLRDYGISNVKITMVVVQKRISTRIYRLAGSSSAENPKPGTIVDQTVTKPNWYDFYMVSQQVRQGTVTPTHYIVVKDTANMPPDHVQKLSYKLCHMYYNWAGTIRVPAPCQYAHKLAYLVGQHIKVAPSSDLSDLLYFL